MKPVNFYKKITEKNLKSIADIVNNVFEIKDLKGYFCENQKIEIYINTKVDINNVRIYGCCVEECIQIFIKSHLNKSLSFLIETIAHELAHNLFDSHDKQHAKATSLLKKIIVCNLRLAGIIK